MGNWQQVGWMDFFFYSKIQKMVLIYKNVWGEDGMRGWILGLNVIIRV